MVGPRAVVFFVMPCFRDVGVRERENRPRFLFDAELSHVLSRGIPGHGREQVDRGFRKGAVRFVASKTDQKREGYTITRTRARNAGEPGGGSAGAFELLLDLLDVHPLLEGGSPLMVRITPQGWKAFTRAQAVATLRLMIANSGRYTDPIRVVFRKNWKGDALGRARAVRAANSAIP